MIYTADNGSLSGLQAVLPKFRTSFYQLLEELKYRRENDEENAKKIENLVAINQDLEEKLEDDVKNRNLLIEENTARLDEQRKIYEDQIKDAEEDKEKARLLNDTSQKEMKSLREEIKKLHLLKFNLEKIIKDQECKLQLMSGARENCLLQISQIESQCSKCFHQLQEVETAMNMLKENVTQASDVNYQVTRQNVNNSKQLEELKQVAETLQNKLFKNACFEKLNTQADEITNSTKLQVQLQNNEEKLAKLKKELDRVKESYTDSQKSLHECRSLLIVQSEAHKLIQTELEEAKQSNINTINENNKTVIKIQTELDMTKDELSNIRQDNISANEKIASLEYEITQLIKLSIETNHKTINYYKPEGNTIKDIILTESEMNEIAATPPEEEKEAVVHVDVDHSPECADLKSQNLHILENSSQVLIRNSQETTKQIQDIQDGNLNNTSQSRNPMKTPPPDTPSVTNSSKKIKLDSDFESLDVSLQFTQENK